MARRDTSFKPTKKESRIPQGFTILGFGSIHFVIQENIVRCLGSELRLDATTPTTVIRRIRIDGRQQGRKVEIIPKPNAAVLVKISICQNAALIGHDDKESSIKDKLRKERWQIVGQYLVKDGSLEEAPSRYR